MLAPVFFFLPSGYCQQTAPQSPQQSACQERTIPLSIYTRTGAPIKNLEAVRLEGFDRGRKIPVGPVTSTILERPLHVILAMDVSGSMWGKVPEHRNLAFDVADDFVAKAPPSVEVGLVLFAEKLRDVIPVSTDRRKLNDELNSVRRSAQTELHGRTALWDALVSIVNLLDHPQAGDAVYLITDGGDNLSKATPDTASETFAAAGVRLFTFLIPEVPGHEDDYAGTAELEEIVADTAGRIVIAPTRTPADFLPWNLLDKAGNPTLFGSALNTQYRQISNSFRVTVQVSEAVDRPRSWRIGVASADAAEKREIRPIYPQKLFPCSGLRN